MAIVKVLDVDFIGEGLNAPKLVKVDKIESSGSLLLLDMSRVDSSFTGLTSGVKLPNLFESQAKVITGTDSDLTYTFANTPTVSKIERTSKGGLYFVSKPAVITPYPNDFMNVRMTGGVRDFIAAQNLAHDFYFGIWWGMVSPADRVPHLSNYSDNNNHNSNRVYYYESGNASIGNWRGEGVTDNKTAISAGIQFNLFNAGRVGLNNAGAPTNWQNASVKLYRFYVEDLTISGRTKEEVRAIDKQLYNEAFAPGGKFYGDTYTDPNTAF